MFGAGKAIGTFDSSADIDIWLQAEREQWLAISRFIAASFI